MAIELRKLGLPSTTEHKDYISMPNMEEVRKNAKITAFKDRLITELTFPGEYNKGSVNPGKSFTVTMVYFLNDFSLDTVARVQNALGRGILSIIAAYAIGCEILQCKRHGLERDREDRTQLVKDQLEYGNVHGNEIRISSIFADVDCCAASRFIPDHYQLSRKVIRNGEFIGSSRYASNEKKSVALVFQILDTQVKPLLESYQIPVDLFLPKKKH